MSRSEMSQRLEDVSGRTLQKVRIHPSLMPIFDTVLDTCEFFFKRGINLPNPPFRGFILEGVPGTGKTEIARQVARKLDERMQSIHYAFVDGATIAAPKWGEAEKNLRDVFNRIKELQNNISNGKLIILFDDIESLMITRGANVAQEWHYALNSILLHEIDSLNPHHMIVLATTNMPNLVDDAIRDRLYSIEVPLIGLQELHPFVTEILEASDVPEDNHEPILKEVINRLSKMENPSIRNARSTTVVVCIERRIWKA